MLLFLKELLQDQKIFKLLINDLLIDINNAKYVDDITMSSISTDPSDVVHYSQASQRLIMHAHGL